MNKSVLHISSSLIQQPSALTLFYLYLFFLVDALSNVFILIELCHCYFFGSLSLDVQFNEQSCNYFADLNPSYNCEVMIIS